MFTIKFKAIIDHSFKRVFNLFRLGTFKAIYSFKGSKYEEISCEFSTTEEIRVNILGNINEDYLSSNVKTVKNDLANEIVFYNGKDIKNQNFFNIFSHKNKILDFKKFKIGIIYVENISYLNNFHLAKEYVSMKNQKVDILHLYIDNNIESKKILSRFNEIYDLGFDLICCLNDNTMLCKAENSPTKMFSKYLYSKFSYDIFPSVEEKNYGHYIKTAYSKKKYWVLKKHGYLSLNNTYKKQRKKINFPIEHNKLVFMQKFEENLVIGDLLNELGLKLNNKIKYLKEKNITNICCRTAEVGCGSIFFFREPLIHNNDKKRLIDKLYIRMAIRAYLSGAILIISYKKLPQFIPHIVCENSIEAHIKAINWIKSSRYPNLKSIGITGSIGKTSTKDMLELVFSEKYFTEKNPRNSNVQAKIGVNVQNIHKDTDVFIQEIGGGRPGGASKHSRMISPDVAVITNIGTAHIGNFNSQEELLNNKLEIEDGLTKNGVVFLNGDDKLLWEARTSHKSVYFGIDNKKCDYYADNIILKEDCSEFDVFFANEKLHIILNVPGKHNILNAVCCVAIAKYYGIANSCIFNGLFNFRTCSSRQNIMKIGKTKVIADCYNASLESTKTALNTLEKFPYETSKMKKIAVIGELTGLGNQEEEIKLEVSKILNSADVDLIIYYSKNKNHLLDSKNKSKIKMVHKKNDVINLINGQLSNGDVVLFKGSSKLKLDEIIDELFGINLADERYIDESKYGKIEKNKIFYNVFEEYCSIEFCSNYKPYIKLRNKVYNRDIKKITAQAFEDCLFESMILPKKIKHIGEKAFAGCAKAYKYENTENIIYIGEKAFSNNIKLEKFVFGDNLKYIGEYAFEGCENIKKTVIPESCVYIGKGAFKRCKNIQKVYVKGNPLIEKDAFDRETEIIYI